MGEKRVWVWHNQAWHKGVVDGADKKKKKRGVRLHDNRRITVSCTFPRKHNGRAPYKSKGEVLPKKRVGPRPPPFSPPVVRVESVAFQGPNRHGDYRWQLEQPQYDRTLHIYNENVSQQRNKQSTCAGAGNACARPYRASGKSIGMPTGEYGGFQSLTDSVGLPFDPFQPHIVKDIIDEAAEEIVQHVLNQPDRFDTIHYCVNANEGTDLIGMGVFRIEHGVRVYITDKIKALPKTIVNRARDQRNAAIYG